MSTKPSRISQLPIVPKPWQTGLAPYYIGLFLGVLFIDQLGTRALPVGGVGWASLGAVVGGLLCFLFLFRIPAIWGQATGKPLVDLAESTFGARGAKWIPGVLVCLGAIVMFAVSVVYATDLTLKGLAAGRFLDAPTLRPMVVGGFTIPGPVFLATSLFWSTAAALVGRFLVRLIAAIMYVFPVFPAIVLALTMMLMLGGLRWFAPTGVDPITHASLPTGRAGLWSMMMVVQMILGFFAMSGVLAADWGVATRSPRDVVIGGWVGACFAPIVIGIISLVAVAGHAGRLNEPIGSTVNNPFPDAQGDTSPMAMARQANLSRSTSLIQTMDPSGNDLTFRDILANGIGGRIGCAMLLIFGVAALAPAVYCAFLFSHRLHILFPKLKRTRWMLIGTFLSWPLVIVGWGERLEPVYTLMGAAFAPLSACISADYWRHGGVWSGPRRGWNRPGWLGWSVGFVVGIIPLVNPRGPSFQPAAFWAFLAAFAVYVVASRLLGESSPVEGVPSDKALAATGG